MDSSRVFVLEANYKLEDGVDTTNAGLLRVIASSTNFYTLYLASDGKVYATEGTSTPCGEALTTLTSDGWTNFKVVLDFENNTKKIYVNDEFAFECVISNTVDLDNFVITTVRVAGFEGKGIGSVAFDEYKCYYADAE